MAEAVAGNLVVNVLANVDKFMNNINKVKEQLQNAGKTITAFGIAAAGGFGFAIKAAADQERATAKLVTALKNYGRATQDNIDDLTKYASTMQELTGVADEVITENQALLASFGMNTEEIKRATTAALNYAAAGNDLGSGMMLLGRAFTGHTETLAKMGIEIKEGISSSEKFDAVLKAFEGRFGGQAEAQRKTFLGQMAAIKNTLGDLAEDIGFILLPHVQRIAEHLKNFIEKIRKVNPDILKISVGVGVVAAGLALVVGPTMILAAKLPAIVAGIKVVMSILMYGGGLTGIGTALALIVAAVVLWIGKWDKLKSSSIILINFLIEKINFLVREFNDNVLPTINKVLRVLTAGLAAPIDKINELNLIVQTASQTSKDAVIADSGTATDVMIANSSKAATAHNTDREKETAKHLEEWDKRITDAQKGHEYLMTFSQELRLKLEEGTVSWTNIFVDSVMQLKDSFASGIADLITEGGKFADAMEEIGKRILNYFIEKVIKKMVDEWLLSHLMMAKIAETSQTTGQATGQFLPAFAKPETLGGNLIAIGSGTLLGSQLGSNIAGQDTSKAGANVGSLAGSVIGNMLLPGVGALIGGALGGVIGGSIKKVGKKIKKVFSGGVLGEPSIITGLRTGAQAIAGEDGPEALVSFRDDLGITPREGRRRMFGFSPRPGLAMAGAGGESITVNIYGQFLEADNAKWDKLVREKIVLPLQRYRKKTAGSLI